MYCQKFAQIASADCKVQYTLLCYLNMLELPFEPSLITRPVYSMHLRLVKGSDLYCQHLTNIRCSLSCNSELGSGTHGQHTTTGKINIKTATTWREYRGKYFSTQLAEVEAL
jgi:hypothetical protein